jgi:outer membrane receptor protein involved in Fe transport
MTADAALRILPSFPTLRRSTSFVADPSSQGLNLRGVAPSAVARALLLEDDRNTLPLPAYGLIDLFASRPLAGGVELFAAVENVADRRYLVGRAGVDTLDAPRIVRAGLRFAAGELRPTAQ